MDKLQSLYLSTCPWHSRLFSLHHTTDHTYVCAQGTPLASHSSAHRTQVVPPCSSSTERTGPLIHSRASSASRQRWFSKPPPIDLKRWPCRSVNKVEHWRTSVFCRGSTGLESSYGGTENDGRHVEIQERTNNSHVLEISGIEISRNNNYFLYFVFNIFDIDVFFFKFAPNLCNQRTQ